MKKDYVKAYLAEYKEMKDSAIKKLKEYGKTLDVDAVCEKRIMEREGYKSVDEIYEEELDDYKWSNTYTCAFEDKHGFIYSCRIAMVRYNENTKDVDVYLESEEGDISEWFDVYRVAYEVGAVYMTIHDFID